MNKGKIKFYLKCASIFLSVILVFLLTCSFIEFDSVETSGTYRYFLDGFSLIVGNAKAMRYYDFFEMTFTDDIYPKSLIALLITIFVFLICFIQVVSTCLQKIKYTYLIGNSINILLSLCVFILGLTFKNSYPLQEINIGIGYGLILLIICSILIALINGFLTYEEIIEIKRKNTVDKVL